MTKEVLDEIMKKAKLLELENEMLKSHTQELHNEINEAKEELEELETKDRLAELEKVILSYYLSKAYKIGSGDWSFKVEITAVWKHKHIAVKFWNNKEETVEYIKINETIKEMFDQAIEYFSKKDSNVK